MKRPSFQFYPGDWLRDTALRTCSVGARGLWIDMICLMHEGSVYGHLKVKDKAITDIQIGRMTGGDLGEVKAWLNELEESGVLSRTEEGIIFSRRMVKDEELRSIRAAGGKEGGNPKLGVDYNKPGYVYAMLRSSDGAVKIGISQDPSKRLYKIKAQYPSDEISVIGKLFVENMGFVEASLHAEFEHCKSGEWFVLTEGEKQTLLNVRLKGKQTPSSASSSASSSSEDQNLLSPPAEKPPKADPIPYQKIIDLYHQTLPTLPKVEILTTKRKGQIASRWRNGLPDLPTWKEYFEHISESGFLMGKKDPTNGHKRFIADLEWLTNETNFAKVAEGKYHGV